MKKIYVLVLTLMVIVGACTKDEVTPAADPKGVKYEVITDSGDWMGEYIIETGEKLCTCPSSFKPSGWTYEFQAAAPFILHIDATTISPLYGTSAAPDVTTNIYVDGKLVATHTSNWAKGNASADYEIR